MKSTLIPYRRKDKWGFSDSSKNIVIDCEYDDVISTYSEANFGLALVKKGKKTCWIDIEGKKITPLADHTHFFTEKEVSVIILNKEIDRVSSFPNCLFVNSQGELLFENNFLTSSHFQNGFCIVMDKDKSYAVIDYTGKLIKPFRSKDYHEVWKSIGSPYNSDTNMIKKPKGKLNLYSDENRCLGYKTNSNKVEIPAKYFHAFEFNEGIAVVAKKAKAFYFINENGNPLFDKSYYFCHGFSNGIAKVVTDTIKGDPRVHSRWGLEYYIPDSAKWGYVDANGNEYWED